MSAMAAAIAGEKIHVFADAAFYDYQTGILTDIAPKVWEIPSLNAVFVCRGVQYAFPVLQRIFAQYAWESWDELKAALPIVWECFDKIMGGNVGDVLLAGFSEEQDRPEILYRTTGEAYEGFQSGYTYLYTEGCMSFGCNIDNGEDPCCQAITAFKKARQQKHDIALGRTNQPIMAHAVGGTLTHTTLTRTSVAAEALIEWPDKVGEVIQP